MRKKDEMEQRVADKAVKITWIVTVFFLFITGVIQNYMNEGEGSNLILIATLSTTLLISLEQYYLSKMNEDKTFKKMMIGAFILSVFLLGSLWLLSQ